MNLSLARVMLRAGIVVSVIFYLVVVDLGVNAGRIHRGVVAGGIEVGGLTRSDARSALERRELDMRTTKIEFGAEGIRVTLKPNDLDWQGGVNEMVAGAWEVGRVRAPIGALGDRFRAWTSGVKIDWAGGLSPFKVTRAVDEVDARVRKEGYELRRYKFRRKIRRAILTWPRQWLRLPLR